MRFRKGFLIDSGKTFLDPDFPTALMALKKGATALSKAQPVPDEPARVQKKPISKRLRIVIIRPWMGKWVRMNFEEQIESPLDQALAAQARHSGTHF